MFAYFRVHFFIPPTHWVSEPGPVTPLIIQEIFPVCSHGRLQISPVTGWLPSSPPSDCVVTGGDWWWHHTFLLSSPALRPANCQYWDCFILSYILSPPPPGVCLAQVSQFLFSVCLSEIGLCRTSPRPSHQSNDWPQLLHHNQQNKNTIWFFCTRIYFLPILF